MQVFRKQFAQFHFISLFCISAVYFFHPVFVPYGLLKNLYRLLLSIVLFYSVTRMMRGKPGKIENAIRIMMVAVFVSILNATLFWQQNLAMSILAALPMFSYCLFFYLMQTKVDISTIEKVIQFTGIAFIFIFFISFFSYPVPVFGDISHYETEKRGFHRILTDGAGFLFLLMFLSLNKYITTRKIYWLFLYGLTLICDFMSLTRVYIVAGIVVSIFYILIKSKWYIKVIFVTLFIIASNYIVNLSFFQELEKKTDRDIAMSDKYVRVASAYYYLREFSPETITRYFGNGAPHTDSSYGKHVYLLQERFQFYIADIGLIGLFVRYGSIAILAYLIIFYHVFTKKLPDRYKYVSMFMAFVLLNGLTNEGTFHPDFILAIVLALYVFQKQYIEAARTKNPLIKAPA